MAEKQQTPLLRIAFYARALHLFAQSAATLTRKLPAHRAARGA
jgi:hypothetical protein